MPRLLVVQYGEDEALHVKVGSHVVWESTHPDDGFTQYSAIFTAEEESPVLRFENGVRAL